MAYNKDKVKELRRHYEEENDLKAYDQLKEIAERELTLLAEQKKEEWLRNNGFNADGDTFIVAGETYSIKETLKADGFIYRPVLMWHQSYIPAGYESKVVKINWREVVDFSAWGEGVFLPVAADYIQQKISVDMSESPSKWVGIDGDAFYGFLVYKGKSSIMGRFGVSYFYTFLNDDGCVFIWSTTKVLNEEVGTRFLVSALIKGHDTYRGVQRTLLKRCTLEKMESET